MHREPVAHAPAHLSAHHALGQEHRRDQNIDAEVLHKTGLGSLDYFKHNREELLGRNREDYVDAFGPEKVFYRVCDLAKGASQVE